MTREKTIDGLKVVFIAGQMENVLHGCVCVCCGSYPMIPTKPLPAYRSGLLLLFLKIQNFTYEWLQLTSFYSFYFAEDTSKASFSSVYIGVIVGILIFLVIVVAIIVVFARRKSGFVSAPAVLFVYKHTLLRVMLPLVVFLADGKVYICYSNLLKIEEGKVSG